MWLKRERESKKTLAARIRSQCALEDIAARLFGIHYYSEYIIIRNILLLGIHYYSEVPNNYTTVRCSVQLLC